MTFTAYFDSDRKCVGVTNGGFAGTYTHSVDIEVARPAEDLYWNGTGAGTRLTDDMSAYPDFIQTGDTIELSAPAQSVLYINGVNEGSGYDVPTTSEAVILLQLAGKYRGEKLISIIDLANRKAERMAELSTIFDTHIAGGCTSPLGWVDCDDKARNRLGAIMDEYTYFGLSTATDTDITMYDQSVVTHTYAEIIDLGAAISTGWRAMWANKQSLQADILAATTVAGLDAIDLETGWP